MKVESEKVDLKLNIQKTKIMVFGPITSWEIDGKQWKQCQTLFWGALKSLQIVTTAMKLKDAYSLEGLPWWLRRLSVCLQCRRPGFDPWVRKIPWRRKWQPTPVLLPGKSHGQRSLVGYSPWGRKESDTTEQLYLTLPMLEIIHQSYISFK